MEEKNEFTPEAPDKLFEFEVIEDENGKRYKVKWFENTRTRKIEVINIKLTEEKIKKIYLKISEEEILQMLGDRFGGEWSNSNNNIDQYSNLAEIDIEKLADNGDVYIDEISGEIYIKKDSHREIIPEILDIDKSVKNIINIYHDKWELLLAKDELTDAEYKALAYIFTTLDLEGMEDYINLMFDREMESYNRFKEMNDGDEPSMTIWDLNEEKLSNILIEVINIYDSYDKYYNKKHKEMNEIVYDGTRSEVESQYLEDLQTVEYFRDEKERLFQLQQMLQNIYQFDMAYGYNENSKYNADIMLSRSNSGEMTIEGVNYDAESFQTKGLTIKVSSVYKDLDHITKIYDDLQEVAERQFNNSYLTLFGESLVDNTIGEIKGKLAKSNIYTFVASVAVDTYKKGKEELENYNIMMDAAEDVSFAQYLMEFKLGCYHTSTTVKGTSKEPEYMPFIQPSEETEKILKRYNEEIGKVDDDFPELTMDHLIYNYYEVANMLTKIRDKGHPMYERYKEVFKEDY